MTRDFLISIRALGMGGGEGGRGWLLACAATLRVGKASVRSGAKGGGGGVNAEQAATAAMRG